MVNLIIAGSNRIFVILQDWNVVLAEDKAGFV